MFVQSRFSPRKTDIAFGAAKRRERVSRTPARFTGCCQGPPADDPYTYINPTYAPKPSPASPSGSTARDLVQAHNLARVPQQRSSAEEEEIIVNPVLEQRIVHRVDQRFSGQ